MIQHYCFTVFTFASFLTWEETTINITVHMLNYTSSFLLDGFSFIVSKRLYHTSFKLNIVNFPRAWPPGPPMNPLKSSQCPHNTEHRLMPWKSSIVRWFFRASASMRIFHRFLWLFFGLKTLSIFLLRQKWCSLGFLKQSLNWLY